MSEPFPILDVPDYTAFRTIPSKSLKDKGSLASHTMQEELDLLGTLIRTCRHSFRQSKIGKLAENTELTTLIRIIKMVNNRSVWLIAMKKVTPLIAKQYSDII